MQYFSASFILTTLTLSKSNTFWFIPLVKEILLVILLSVALDGKENVDDKVLYALGLLKYRFKHNRLNCKEYLRPLAFLSWSDTCSFTNSIVWGPKNFSQHLKNWSLLKSMFGICPRRAAFSFFRILISFCNFNVFGQWAHKSFVVWTVLSKLRFAPSWTVLCCLFVTTLSREDGRTISEGAVTATLGFAAIP